MSTRRSSAAGVESGLLLGFSSPLVAQDKIGGPDAAPYGTLHQEGIDTGVISSQDDALGRRRQGSVRPLCQREAGHAFLVAYPVNFCKRLGLVEEELHRARRLTREAVRVKL